MLLQNLFYICCFSWVSYFYRESSFYNSLPGAQACSWNLSQTNLLITLCDWCCELFLPIIHNQTWPFLFMSKKEILCGFKVYILLWKSKPYCHIDFFLSIHLDIILLHTVSAHVHLSASQLILDVMQKSSSTQCLTVNMAVCSDLLSLVFTKHVTVNYQICQLWSCLSK